MLERLRAERILLRPQDRRHGAPGRPAPARSELPKRMGRKRRSMREEVMCAPTALNRAMTFDRENAGRLPFWMPSRALPDRRKSLRGNC